METLVLFGIVSLATYRIARMIASERGPADVFRELRVAVLKRWPDKELIFTHKHTAESKVQNINLGGEPSWQFDGITCVDCLSFWLAWLTALALPFESWALYALNALAVSAMCVLINHNSK